MPRYRLYIDESGDHTYSASEDDPAHRYLGLTGVVIENDYYRTTMHAEFEALKQRHFPHSPDEPVVLHRKELTNRRGAFSPLAKISAEAAWNADLLNCLAHWRYLLITVVIDKVAHLERYEEAAQHPYHLCLAFILERYCGYLRVSRSRGDVLAESRGGAEDKELKRAYEDLWNNGTYYQSRQFFQEVLTSKKLKLKKKDANITGLQMADLIAHPSKGQLLTERGLLKQASGFALDLCGVIQAKYNSRWGTGQVWGYGKKVLT